VLNVPDSAIRSFADLVTRWTSDHITTLFAQVDTGALSMREIKHLLAWEIVSIFHGDAAADQAAADALRMHLGEAPSDTPSFVLQAPMNVVDLLFSVEVVKSKSEGRRLVEQGGVRLDGVTINDVAHAIQPQAVEQVMQIGKRKFLRIVPA
jgi:tyrosyl-tRNA synthetase